MAKTRTRPTPRKAPAKGRRRPGSRKKPPPPWYQRYSWLPWAVGLGVLAIVVIALRAGQPDRPAPGVAVENPVVGADLHSLVVDPEDPDRLYIGSHSGVSVSTDGGDTWEVVGSLNGADAMGWAFTDELILVGGHPGLSVSTDGGDSFEQRNEGLPSTDVHALGAGDKVIYAGLAGVGTFASTDGGMTWEARSEEVGGAFMGRIQVDPADDDHILAPDMEAGAVESTDGGLTWKALGGVQGAMWVTWESNDTDHIVVTTQGSAAESTDGGESWEPFEIPDGASIVEFSPHDREVLYAAVLEDPNARVFISRDGGGQWEPQ
ncbi:MAG: hypothetical protein M3280_05335 [Actinomycetota bacterium]|nr:hypothetical protein [Actinomycetota bacterium]